MRARARPRRPFSTSSSPRTPPVDLGRNVPTAGMSVGTVTPGGSTPGAYDAGAGAARAGAAAAAAALTGAGGGGGGGASFLIERPRNEAAGGRGGGGAGATGAGAGTTPAATTAGPKSADPPTARAARRWPSTNAFLTAAKSSSEIRPSSRAALAARRLSMVEGGRGGRGWPVAVSPRSRESGVRCESTAPHRPRPRPPARPAMDDDGVDHELLLSVAGGLGRWVDGPGGPTYEKDDDCAGGWWGGVV